MARLQESLKPVVHRVQTFLVQVFVTSCSRMRKGYYVYCRNIKHREGCQSLGLLWGGGHARKGLLENCICSHTIHNSKCSLSFITPQGTCRTLFSPTWLFKLSTCPMPLPHSCSHSTRLSSHRSSVPRDVTLPDVSWMLVRKCLLL
jgi:hypothetical protein